MESSNNENNGRPLYCEALGRSAFIGSLYDAIHDEFTETSIFNDEIPTNAIHKMEENYGKSSYEIDTSLTEKLSKLNVGASLSLSVIGGLVKCPGATASYLYSHSSNDQTVHATLIHEHITRTELVNLCHEEVKAHLVPSALEHTKNATHVVVGIQWGADIFARIEATGTSADIKHNAKLDIKLELSKLLKKIVDVNITGVKDSASSSEVDDEVPPQLAFQHGNKSSTFKCSINIFGDAIPHPVCPKSIEEAVALLPTLSSTQIEKTNGGKGRPLKYTMLPVRTVAEIIGQSVTHTRIYREMEEDLILDTKLFAERLDQIHNSIQSIHSSIQHVNKYFSTEEVDRVSLCERRITQMQRNFKSRLSKILVDVRSCVKEPNELAALLNEFETPLNTERDNINQFNNGEIGEKIKFVFELNAKDVHVLREPADFLSIFKLKYPQDQLVVLYTSDNIRYQSKEKWATVYYDFMRRIGKALANDNHSPRQLFFYLDYDHNPTTQVERREIKILTYNPLIDIETTLIPANAESTSSLHKQSSIANVAEKREKYVDEIKMGYERSGE